MAIIPVADLQMYVEEQGSGPPLLLIMGLGWNADGWRHNQPTLAQSFRAIAYDGRGIGRTSRGDLPQYGIDRLADDAAALLDALGLDSAHVYGVSMGGMVAQEVALRHPGRIQRLVLGCTTCGRRGVQPRGEQASALNVKGARNAREALWAAVPSLYSPAFIAAHRDVVEQDVELRLAHPPRGGHYFRQLAAARAHDTYDRLPDLQAPTLVLHGELDLLVPPLNADILAGRIPRAEQIRFPHAAHMYHVEVQAEADAAVGAFLGRSQEGGDVP